MHSAVLAIVAEPLDEALIHAQRVHKLRADIGPLLDALKQHMQKHRHAAAAFSELETWATTPRLGLQSALSNSIHSLILWCLAESSGSAGTSSPPNYTHRLLRSAVTLLGAKATLKVLIDEVLAQIDNGNGNDQDVDIVLDIVVTMTVAPNPTSSSGRLSLRDVLRADFEDVNELSKTDAGRARVVVRLQRRVENYLFAGGQAGGGPGGGMEMEIQGEGGVGEMVLGSGEGGIVGGGVGDMVLSGGEGMPEGDIDDVLKRTEERMRSGDFLGGGGAGEGVFGMG